MLIKGYVFFFLGAYRFPIDRHRATSAKGRWQFDNLATPMAIPAGNGWPKTKWLISFSFFFNRYVRSGDRRALPPVAGRALHAPVRVVAGRFAAVGGVGGRRRRCRRRRRRRRRRQRPTVAAAARAGRLDRQRHRTLR